VGVELICLRSPLANAEEAAVADEQVAESINTVISVEELMLNNKKHGMHWRRQTQSGPRQGKFGEQPAYLNVWLESSHTVTIEEVLAKLIEDFF